MNANLWQFHDVVDGAYRKILETEEGSIDRAADLVAGSIQRDELINVFGTGGHSSMGAMEMFWRAGALAAIRPLLEPAILPSMGAKHSNWMERTEGLAASVLNAYEVKAGETMIIVNAYGINGLTIDTALECRRRGLRTIGVASKSFAESVPKGVPARHSSGLNLHEVVDVHVNNYMPYGDASVRIEGFDQALAPVSTLVNCFCLHLIVIRTAEKLVAMGIEPPVWVSGNMPEGDAKNRRWHEKYDPRVKHLR